MKKRFAGVVLTLLLFTACEKSEVLPFDLAGTLKGQIYTHDEFGFPSGDNGDVVIHLEGSDPLISTLTDSAGNYEIRGIPSGTYNLIISKEGYGEHQRQGFQIVGGNKPLYFYTFIIEKSTTTIENVSLEIINDTEVYLKGTVNHNYVMDEWGFNALEILCFIHNQDNPSDTAYLQTRYVRFEGESGSQMENAIYIDKDIFPSGSKIYLIAYGHSRYGYGYYDILSNQYRYPTLGAGSNIASITVP